MNAFYSTNKETYEGQPDLEQYRYISTGTTDSMAKLSLSNDQKESVAKKSIIFTA